MAKGPLSRVALNKTDGKSDEAKLKVKFYVPPFLPLIPVTALQGITGFCILMDYQYALIGQPSEKSLWILSWKSNMDEETYNMLVQKAIGEGYDVSKLRKTPHSDTPPGSEESPNDKGIWWLKSVVGK